MYTDSFNDPAKLKRRRRWFLAGAIGSALLVFFDMQFRFFYETVLKLDLRLFATIWTVFSVWNAVNDPLFGFLSDRTKTRLGRRRPYLLIGAIPFGLCFYFMFNPIINLTVASQITIAIYAFCILFLYDGFYSLVYCNWMALIPEMYRDQNDLRRFNLVRLAIAMVFSVIFTVAIPYLRLGDPESPNMFLIGLIPGVLMPICILLASRGAVENPVYQKTFDTSVLLSIKQALKNRHFMGFILYHSMFNVGKFLMVSNIAILGYYKIISGELLGMSFESLMIPVVFVTLTGTLPLWNVLFKRVTKDWTNVICLIVSALACLLLQFSSSIYIALIVAIIIGFTQSGYSLSHDLYNARQLDYHFAQTGQRSEGSYAGVGVFFDRLIQAVGPWVIVIIGAIGGYKAGMAPSEMTSSSLLAVRSISGAGAAFFFTIAAILSAVLYGLRGQKWKEVEARAKAKDEELKLLYLNNDR